MFYRVSKEVDAGSKEAKSLANEVDNKEKNDAPNQSNTPSVAGGR